MWKNNLAKAKPAIEFTKTEINEIEIDRTKLFKK